MASFIRGPAFVGAASCRERAMKLSCISVQTQILFFKIRHKVNNQLPNPNNHVIQALLLRKSGASDS